MSQHDNRANLATEPAETPPGLPATLRLGAVHLTVTDLDRSVAYYEGAIGLGLHRRESGVAAMGVGGEDLLVLYEEPGARRAGRHAGLYHYALLFPSREELARAALRLAATGTPIQGASDHGTHEAIYLPDPDGNGIELAADRPREMWPPAAEYSGGPHPLDLDGLLGGGRRRGAAGQAASGLAVGHVHLHVGDLERGLAFYRDVLGFELMTSYRAPRRSWPPAATTTTSASTSGAEPACRPPRTAGWACATGPWCSKSARTSPRSANGSGGRPRGRGARRRPLVRDPWNIAVQFITPRASAA